MNIFSYTRYNEMSPRGNNKFFTTYIKMSRIEYFLLKEFIEEALQEIQVDIEKHNNIQEWTEPDTRFKKTTGKFYSKIDIVLDLYHQLNDNKDPTLSLVNRWNKLFINTAYEFEIRKSK